MKMIYVGSLSLSPDRDSGWVRAFRGLGLEVFPYSSEPCSLPQGILGRICRRLNFGKAFDAVEEGLLKTARKNKPDWVHFRLPIEFSNRTILELRKMDIVVTEYFNDDPFSKKNPLGLHWKFRRTLSAYDAHFVYRKKNIDDFLNAGAKAVYHCAPTYDPSRHLLTERLPEGQFLADASFIGHWEADWREECIVALLQEGFTVIVKGGLWERENADPLLKKLYPIKPIFGQKYNYIYANSVAGLCFFSKINNDTWTERALEIIAVGGVLICERTSETQSYFKDGEEACFFSSIDELIRIVRFLKENPDRREQIRASGYRRLISDRHTIDDRAREIFSVVGEITEKRIGKCAG